MSKFYIELDSICDFLAHLEEHYNAENGFNLKEQIIVKSAIDQVRRGNWFKEDLYARFNITAIDGHWPAFDKEIIQERSND